MMPSFQETREGQLHYILQWFGEFSELQKSDFLIVLAHGFHPECYEDGMPAGYFLTPQDDAPESLFQIRVNLFKQWIEDWTEAEKENLIYELSERDGIFISNYEDIINKVGVEPSAPIEEEIAAPVAAAFDIPHDDVIDWGAAGDHAAVPIIHDPENNGPVQHVGDPDIDWGGAGDC